MAQGLNKMLLKVIGRVGRHDGIFRVKVEMRLLVEMWQYLYYRNSHVIVLFSRDLAQSYTLKTNALTQQQKITVCINLFEL